MMPLYSSVSVRVVLTVCVYLTHSTSSTTKCGLQLTENIKGQSVALRAIDKRLCQTECVQDSYILAYCRRSSDEFKRGDVTEVYNARPESQHNVRYVYVITEIEDICRFVDMYVVVCLVFGIIVCYVL